MEKMRKFHSIKLWANGSFRLKMCRYLWEKQMKLNCTKDKDTDLLFLSLKLGLRSFKNSTRNNWKL